MTTAVPALTHDQLSLVSEAFKLLGDPTRLRIVIYCLDGPKSVGDIAGTLNLSQTLVSHHLRLLRSARLLRAERQSRHVYYQIADHHISHMIADLTEHVMEENS
ncbi:ArsR/SmtB family transcription factor [Falsirhodobacter sp. 1013]|uniref:ArsR/SmtB family transcription factor n=1 Tax=Falsirhodobacter sp. 1013 TaxID=3417566 RepID=UPI003EBE3032